MVYGYFMSTNYTVLTIPISRDIKLSQKVFTLIGAYRWAVQVNIARDIILYRVIYIKTGLRQCRCKIRLNAFLKSLLNIVYITGFKALLQ